MDGDKILEEVKVFGALNAQMEQLVSLENEFLRGATARLPNPAGSDHRPMRFYCRSVGACCDLSVVLSGLRWVSCAQRSTSRRSCCWPATWPHPSHARHPPCSSHPHR